MANKLDIVVAVQDNATAGLKRVTQGLNQFDERLKRSTLGTNQFGAAVNDNTRGLSRFAKSGLQQAGYQVGDFAVQVSGGTSAIQAFGQQGSQLLGIFGPVGAILGAGVAIVAAIGVAMEKSSGAAINFNDAISKVKDTASDLIEATDMMSQKLARLRLDLAFTAIQKATASASDEVAKLTGNGGLLMKIYEKISKVDFAREQARALEDLSKKLGLGKDDTQKLVDVFKQLSTGSLQAAQALAVSQQGLDILNQSTKQNTEEYASFLEKLIAVRDASDQVTSAIEKQGTGGKSKIKELNEELKKQADIFDTTLTQPMQNFFMSILMGTAKAKDAFKAMASSIISELFRILVVEQMVQSIVGVVRGIFKPATGATTVKTAATGGIMSANKPVLVGERGAELFIPHTAGRIEPNNNLGNGQVVVNQTINVSTGVQQTVRNEIQSMLPQIANASKAAVLDARRRGGSFANAF